MTAHEQALALARDAAARPYMHTAPTGKAFQRVCRALLALAEAPATCGSCRHYEVEEPGDGPWCFLPRRRENGSVWTHATQPHLSCADHQPTEAK